MVNFTTTQNIRKNSRIILITSDEQSLIEKNLKNNACFIYKDATSFRKYIQQKQVANDVQEGLHEFLEVRYGSGFAQWVIDGLEAQNRVNSF